MEASISDPLSLTLLRQGHGRSQRTRDDRFHPSCSERRKGEGPGGLGICRLLRVEGLSSGFVLFLGSTTSILPKPVIVVGCWGGCYVNFTRNSRSLGLLGVSRLRVQYLY